jgi:16S rRNA (cytosine967-C5)-methyltransferase
MSSGQEKCRMPTPARLKVAQALADVFIAGSKVREGWDNGLSAEDAKLAHAILGHCLRKWGRLGAWCSKNLKDPVRGLPTNTKIALHIGLAQLAWLPGVASHAAVSEAVELVSMRGIGFLAHKGLVNSILRAASKDRARLGAELESLPTSLDRTPIAERLLKDALQGGFSLENAEALWHKLQQPPSPAFVVLRGEPPSGLVKDAQWPNAYRLMQGCPYPLDWLRSGEGMVQDLSSQALMRFDWANLHSRPLRIADLCAAPGGKTTSLFYRWPNSQLFAIDQSPARARRLGENLKARNVSAQIDVADAAAWLCGQTEPFDIILIDAPCSSSGTIRKHPEIVWTLLEPDICRLAIAQAKLLEAAIPKLAPGGLLIYSVCSWFPQEGICHLSRLRRDSPNIRPAAVWGCSHIFCPDPLTWEGEGFQAFALTMD